MKDIKDLLKEQPFFKEMSEELIAYVAGCGQNKHFAHGEYLGRENEPSDHLYLIRKGKIAVQLADPIRGDLTICSLGPGEMAGFSWIIPPYKLHFDLKALEHTSVVALDGTCLRQKCDEDHDLGYLLMKGSAVVMEKRLNDTRLQLLDVYH